MADNCRLSPWKPLPWSVAPNGLSPAFGDLRIREAYADVEEKAWRSGLRLNIMIFVCMFTQRQLYFILEDHLLGITSFTCLLDYWQLSLTTTLKGRLDLTIPRLRQVTMISQYGLGYRGSAYSAHDTTNLPFLWKGIQDAALYLEKLTTRACLTRSRNVWGSGQTIEEKPNYSTEPYPSK